MEHNSRAELSYSLPGFSPGEYYESTQWLLDLKDLGFPCVTFTPTYLVYDELPMRLDPARGPKFDGLARAVGFALEAGLAVQVDPHLDWESTLTGGPYEWRRRMYFNPFESYFEQIIAPIAGLLWSAGAERCALTLGSELDVSLVEFAPQWAAIADSIRGAAPKLALGQKLNGDSLDAGESIRTDLNAERKRRGLPAVSRSAYTRQVRQIGLYLRDLDFVSFSFYPTVPPHSDMPRVFDIEARRLRAKLHDAAGDKPQFRIGEFGLGSSDTTRPWYFDAKTMLGPDGSLDEKVREVRRRFYTGLLKGLEGLGGDVGRVSFWTVAQYDFLGVLGNDVYRDDVLRAAVHSYNEATET